MENRSPIVAFSVPFVAGVGISAALCVSCCPFASTAALLVSTLSSALLYRKVTDGTWQRILFALMAFSAGIFCFTSRSMIIDTGIVRLPGFAVRCREAMTARIAAVPFGDAGVAALLCALLTGERGGLGGGVKDAFRASGASHILALSGLHLGIISTAVRKLLGLFGRSRIAFAVRAAVTVALAGFYTVVCGAGPSLVRAFIYIVLSEIRRLSPGRRGGGVQSLCTALTLQLALSPGSIGTVSFQLSYLAMAGIAIVYPRLESWFPGKALTGRIWRSAAMSLACQLFTAPLVWFRFHTFPVHFLLTNLIALPLSEATIILGILSALFPSSALLVSLTERLATLLLTSLQTIAGM